MNNQVSEHRRKWLMDKLMIMGMLSQKDDELSLRELERKYRRVKSKSHPHSQMDSLHFITFTS
ncbi:Fur-regulated basic protein FbpA [Siminovitchia sediminis]|uniref:Fur-regulated basic protein FbpA n=1 Tax=Siminovitchia sediminis TaxID=1274353 RepID=A0ABW4KHX6_9BACI